MKAVNPAMGTVVPETSKERYRMIMQSLKKPARSPKIHLQKRLDELPEGQALDVSAMNPNGTGIRKVNMPPKAGKYGTANVAIVSSDFDRYLMAIRMLADGERTYTEDLIYMAGLLGVSYTPLGSETPLSTGPSSFTPVGLIPKSVVAPKRSPAKTNIEDRIRNLAPGKVLDVSAIKENGTNAHTIDQPPGLSKKIGTDTLDIVSNNFDHYLMAIRMIPNGEQRYAGELQVMAEHFGVPYTKVPDYGDTGDQAFDQEEAILAEQANEAEEIAQMGELDYE
jgi:hypothetical protein